MAKQRTLSGLNVGDFDELTVEDDFSLLGAFKAGEIQSTGNISCVDVSASGDATVAGGASITGNTTITGSLTAASLNAGSGAIQTTGTISTSGTVSGQTLSGLTLSLDH